MNVFRGRFKDHHLVHFTVNKEETPITDSTEQLYVRPHEIQVYPAEEKHVGDLRGVIIRVRFVANTVFLEIKLRLEQANETSEEQLVEASITEEQWEAHKFKLGDAVNVRIKNATSFD